MTEKETIGKYDIIAELGRGGMGVVFKAWEDSLQRFVAIKMLADQLTQDEVVVQRFLREARAVADLNHPNVVQVFAVDTHENRPYFAMEYVEGESLTELIRTSRRIDPKRAVQLLKEAANGLAAAHGKGVVHRDIKPDNIMLTKHGGVKVVDFGVAKIDDPDSKLTATGMAVGTPNYISPEVCLGKEVDARSDIFSLGIVFFEMLAGETPFNADSPIAMMTAVVNAEIPDITTLNSAVDEPLRLILSHMLKKDTAERYQTCKQLVEDLENYTAGRPPGNALQALSDETIEMRVPRDATTATTQSAPIQPAAVGGRRGPKTRWVVLALLLVSTGAAGWYYFNNQSGGPPGQLPQTTPEVAVEAQIEAEVEPSQPQIELQDSPAVVQSEDVALVIPQDPMTQTTLSTPVLEPEQVLIDNVPSRADATLRTEAAPRADATPPQQAIPAPTNAPPKLVVIASGDPAVSTVVESVLENALVAAEYLVMDEQFFDGLDLEPGFSVDLARVRRNVEANGADILVFADIRQAGERRLTFYGRTERQITANLQVRALVLAGKRSLGAPWVGNLEYVPLNASDQARDVTQPIAQELVERLQALN